METGRGLGMRRRIGSLVLDFSLGGDFRGKTPPSGCGYVDGAANPHVGDCRNEDLRKGTRCRRKQVRGGMQNESRCVFTNTPESQGWEGVGCAVGG